MTVKELIKEVAKGETGWCLCSSPDLQINHHIEEPLLEKIVERVIDRCEKAMTDTLHHYDIVDMEDGDGATGAWIKEEFRKRVLPVVSGTETE